MGYLSNAGVFLIQVGFGLYEVLILLRLLMQYVRADFHNPFSRFIVQATNPPLRPLRRIIPGLAGIDMASVVLLLLVILIELLLLGVVLRLPSPNPVGLLLLAAVEGLRLLIHVYLFSILILVILSWVNPGGYNPVAHLLAQITAPVMRPARRLLPPMGGLDLSPMLVLIGLYLLILLLVDPLGDLATGLTYNRGLAAP
ncbi:MAG TPA: YggT family protein [Chromatiales bacterium]|nr:YggT family protein [Chromatiales bacterium]